MILKFVSKIKSIEILTEETMKNIRSGKCQKFDTPMSYECKCENGQVFQAVITDDCDIDFYRTHFCNNEELVCESVEKIVTK